MVFFFKTMCNFSILAYDLIKSSYIAFSWAVWHRRAKLFLGRAVKIQNIYVHYLNEEREDCDRIFGSRYAMYARQYLSN